MVTSLPLTGTSLTSIRQHFWGTCILIVVVSGKWIRPLPLFSLCTLVLPLFGVPVDSIRQVCLEWFTRLRPLECFYRQEGFCWTSSQRPATGLHSRCRRFATSR